MLRKYQRVTLTYPKQNQIHCVGRFTPRPLQILSVRDLVLDPLTIQEYFRRPLVKRSRYLVSAIDLQLNRRRQFYLGATAEFRTESPLRVGIYQADGKPLEIIGRSFGNSVRERIILTNVLRFWAKQDLDDGLRIGIFADDLNLIVSD